MIIQNTTDSPIPQSTMMNGLRPKGWTVESGPTVRIDETRGDAEWLYLVLSFATEHEERVFSFSEPLHLPELLRGHTFDLASFYQGIDQVMMKNSTSGVFLAALEYMLNTMGRLEFFLDEAAGETFTFNDPVTVSLHLGNRTIVLVIPEEPASQIFTGT